jgi:hypothetical protein
LDDKRKKARETAKKLRAQAKQLDAAAGNNRSGYDDHKRNAAARQSEQSAEGRDIGDLPEVVDPKRREKGSKSLLDFCRIYFPARFPWAFSKDHEEAAARIERCGAVGGNVSIAMPRGAGKTTLVETDVIRDALYGFRRFIPLLQANDKLAARSLKKIKKELETNKALAEDFPEVIYPILKLERIHNRANGQTFKGEPTRIEWTAEGITLPTIAGSKASGTQIMVSGIEGAVRGLSMVGPNGEIIRPDKVIIDDAQTRATAKSPTQTSDREAIICDDVLGCAGPGVRMAAIMLCTVIYPGDLSDRFLSHDRHPEWQGLRTKMLNKFPTDMKLWDEYSEVRRESLRSGDGGKRANTFYRKNRKAMDAGAEISWKQRFKSDEVSAIQSAMNLFYENPRGFAAEYQNEPELSSANPGAKELVPAEVSKRLSRLDRGIVRKEATRLTAFVDCGGGVGRGLWYAVCDWDQTYGGSVVDYGCWPRQTRTNFAADDMRPGLAEAYPTLSQEQRLYRGLEALGGDVLGKRYTREGTGEQLPIDRCIIDAGWFPKVVAEFVRQSPYGNIIYPSKGYGRTKERVGVAGWKTRDGERRGHHWRLTVNPDGKGRMVMFDPDAWKSFLYERFTTPIGGGGAMVLFGDKADTHEMLCDHLAAESSEPETMRGETFDKWKVKPHRPDNHWLDCLVGCAMAASVQGLTMNSNPSVSVPDKPMNAKPKMSLLDRYNAKHKGGKR